MNKENIILIGMPGSGKSTCGVLAAKALLKNFFDTDLLFQGLEEKRLQDIIDDDGIEYFLSAEERAILSLDINATVVATGGSVVYSDKSMEHLKKSGKVIYLHLSYDTMVDRIKNITTRGVVVKEGDSLEDMYNERLPMYQKWADVVINCDNNTVEQTVEKIVKASSDCEKKS
ncbi:shikimate kinase [uncultured Eubacterium sp.]|uniref:shikimate kinase n=1 Tax=uncultured Eubacterium sp. TaxID=165185 RepID=UPI0025D5E1E8|nr:shikimate kinase [uncultured Eubacterium sp.]MDD5837019.1 shikimate kinase [Eubacteriales bacterium]